MWGTGEGTVATINPLSGYDTVVPTAPSESTMHGGGGGEDAEPRASCCCVRIFWSSPCRRIATIAAVGLLLLGAGMGSGVEIGLGIPHRGEGGGSGPEPGPSPGPAPFDPTVISINGTGAVDAVRGSTHSLLELCEWNIHTPSGEEETQFTAAIHRGFTHPAIPRKCLTVGGVPICDGGRNGAAEFGSPPIPGGLEYVDDPKTKPNTEGSVWRDVVANLEREDGTKYSGTATEISTATEQGADVTMGDDGGKLEGRQMSARLVLQRKSDGAVFSSPSCVITNVGGVFYDHHRRNLRGGGSPTAPDHSATESATASGRTPSLSAKISEWLGYTID